VSRVAIVTGGASGIGLATVRRLELVDVAVTSFDLQGTHSVDVADERGVAEVRRRHGPIDRAQVASSTWPRRSIPPRHSRPSWITSRRYWHKVGDSSDAVSPSCDKSFAHVLHEMHASRPEERALV